jgi:feruloyl-CoA synthase
MQVAARDLRLGPRGVDIERRIDGAMIVRSKTALQAYPARLTDRLEHWAVAAPQRVLFAQRRVDGDWRTVTYREAFDEARAIGQALLGFGLSVDRPLAILSGNDIEHALLALAALYVGVPYSPVSPAYSLVSTDFGKLGHVVGLLTPGAIYVANGGRFEKALHFLKNGVAPDAEILFGASPPKDIAGHDFGSLNSKDPRAAESAHAAVGPDTIAKVLFTSGSTGMPKGVINTQRMICSNQAMITQSLAFLEDEPPVLVDWLPWNHTFGGNHNFGIALFNGGSLYIDDGKPVPNGIGATLRNLREIAPTLYFNVPVGYEALLPHLRSDRALRESFFRRLKMMYYAGAGLKPDVWEELESLAIEAIGQRVSMMTGLGSTETAPFALISDKDEKRPGIVGLPAPGVELKLTVSGDKLEARLRGPNITPGYWRQPELTEKAFDSEGFYLLGDALRFVDPEVPDRGLLFDGRITEDFKLATGTWVSVGSLRAAALAALSPLVTDIVVCGHDRDDIRVMLFPDVVACRDLCAGVADATPSELFARAEIRSAIADRLRTLSASSTGSSNRITAAVLLDEEPSLDAGEITDKGSINQRAVLTKRFDMVEELYRSSFASDRVITVDRA